MAAPRAAAQRCGYREHRAQPAVERHPAEVISAALVLASLPTIVFFLVFQRNILAGLGAGAIKD